MGSLILMKKMTTQTVKNDSEFEYADLSHSVSTLGAAVRSLSRHPDYVGVAAELKLILNELTSDLMLRREKKRERETK